MCEKNIYDIVKEVESGVKDKLRKELIESIKHEEKRSKIENGFKNNKNWNEDKQLGYIEAQRNYLRML